MTCISNHPDGLFSIGVYRCRGVLCATPIWPGDRLRVFLRNERPLSYEVGLAHIQLAGSLEHWLINPDPYASYATFYNASPEGTTIEIERTPNEVVLHTGSLAKSETRATACATIPEYIFVWGKSGISNTFISISNVHSKKC
jgi:hypothetical protein